MAKHHTEYSFTSAGVAHAALLSSLQDAAYSPQDERFWSEESFAETLNSVGVMARVILVKKTPVGFCVMRMVAGEAEVLTIGILPTSQRRGLGKALLNDCLTTVMKNGANTVFLEVRADNISAIHTYKGCGFVENGMRKGYYRLENGHLVDAKIYSLDLKM